jgi:allophanate hydrolase subunit 1
MQVIQDQSMLYIREIKAALRKRMVNSRPPFLSRHNLKKRTRLNKVWDASVKKMKAQWTEQEITYVSGGAEDAVR